MEIRRAKPEECSRLSEIAICSKAYWGYDDPFMEACRDALTISEVSITSNLAFVVESSLKNRKRSRTERIYSRC